MCEPVAGVFVTSGEAVDNEYTNWTIRKEESYNKTG